MRHYEFLFILKPTLSEEELKAKVASMNETIIKNGGEIAKCDELGIKNLAYDIEKNARGFYAVTYFTAPPSAITEIERIARLNEDLLKFLTVKFDSKKDRKQWDKLSKVKEVPKVEPKKEETPTVETKEAPEVKEEVPAETKEEAPAEEVKEVPAETKEEATKE